LSAQQEYSPGDMVLGQTIKAFLVHNYGERLECRAIQDPCAEKMPRQMVQKQFEVMKGAAKDLEGKMD